MDWLDVLKDLGITAGISAVIPILVTYFINKRNDKKDKLDEIEKRVSDVEKFKKDYESDAQDILKKLDSLGKSVGVYRESLHALLKDRIIEMYNEYMPKEELPIYKSESLNEMYTQYMASGSGEDVVISPLVEQMNNLPTKKVNSKDNEWILEIIKIIQIVDGVKGKLWVLM